MTVRTCKQCGGTRPAGRTTYCSDACHAAASAEREMAKQQSRMTPCARCGREKELGSRGRKYCDSCRAVVGDTQAHLEFERNRRRHLDSVEERLTAGEAVKRRGVGVPEGSKWCSRCQQFRPLEAFHKRKDSSSKKVAYCYPCQKSYNQERRLRVTFGLTWDEYELLLACQDHRCAICGGKPRKTLLAVDHDHKTGEIRGLLCSRCNHKLLGSANDDPSRLRRAADYLEAFEPRDVFGGPKYVPGSEQELGY